MNENIDGIKSSPQKQGWNNLFKAVSFIVIFAILLSVTSRIVIPKSNKDLKQYSAAGFYGEPKNTLDYVMLGDSNSAEGFSPLEVWKEYGYTGFVCGEPFQTACGAYNVLKEVLSCQSPKLVIIESNIFYAISQKSNLLYKNDEMTDLDKSVESELSSVFPVVRYHNNWKKLTLQDFTTTTDYSWKPSNKGYAYSNIQGTCSEKDYMKASRKFEPINQVAILYMYKLISLCKKNNINIVFLSVPSPTSWNSIRHNELEFFSKKTGVPYVDLNNVASDIGIDFDTDTRDGIHLNYYGAQKASMYIGDYINKNYQLTDHRNDANFSDWSQDLQNYEASVSG